MEIQGITESIFQHLKNEIITGNLAPNLRLSEERIAASLGVSRAPLREALRLLENDNFVVRLPRRGAYVADLIVENLDYPFVSALFQPLSLFGDCHWVPILTGRR